MVELCCKTEGFRLHLEMIILAHINIIIWLVAYFLLTLCI